MIYTEDADHFLGLIALQSRPRSHCRWDIECDANGADHQGWGDLVEAWDDWIVDYQKRGRIEI